MPIVQSRIIVNRNNLFVLNISDLFVTVMVELWILIKQIRKILMYLLHPFQARLRLGVEQNVQFPRALVLHPLGDCLRAHRYEATYVQVIGRLVHTEDHVLFHVHESDVPRGQIIAVFQLIVVPGE